MANIETCVVFRHGRIGVFGIVCRYREGTNPGRMKLSGSLASTSLVGAPGTHLSFRAFIFENGRELFVHIAQGSRTCAVYGFRTSPIAEGCLLSEDAFDSIGSNQIGGRRYWAPLPIRPCAGGRLVEL